MKVTLSDFKKVVGNSWEKIKGNPGNTKLSEDTISDCVQMLESLGINLDQFLTDTTKLVGTMNDAPRTCTRWSDKDFVTRVIATGGLQWNSKSKHVAQLHDGGNGDKAGVPDGAQLLGAPYTELPGSGQHAQGV